MNIFKHIKIPKGNGQFRDIFILEDQKLKNQAKFFSKVLLKRAGIKTNLIKFSKELGKICRSDTCDKNYPMFIIKDKAIDCISKLREFNLPNFATSLDKLYQKKINVLIYETDIKDCFHSIDVNQFPYGFEILEKIRSSLDIDKNALYIKNRKKLLIPQGFPASPIIVDFLLRNLDHAIMNFLANLPYAIHMLRYADNYFILFEKNLPEQKRENILKYIMHIILSRNLSLKHGFKCTDKAVGLTIAGDPHPDTILRLLSHVNKKFDQAVFNGVIGYLSQFDFFSMNNIQLKNELQLFFQKGGNINASIPSEH